MHELLGQSWWSNLPWEACDAHLDIGALIPTLDSTEVAALRFVEQPSPAWTTGMSDAFVVRTISFFVSSIDLKLAQRQFDI